MKLRGTPGVIGTAYEAVLVAVSVRKYWPPVSGI